MPTCLNVLSTQCESISWCIASVLIRSPPCTDYKYPFHRPSCFQFIQLNTGIIVCVVAVSTLAGSGAQGSIDGMGIYATFNQPYGLSIDLQGRLIVADTLNHIIRVVLPSGMVSTLAGSGSPGLGDGTGTNAMFHYPDGTAVDIGGDVIVVDSGNNCIRLVSTAVGSVLVTTLAGTGSAGYVDGSGSNARFSNPYSVAVATGSQNIFVGDPNNNVIRLLSSYDSVLVTSTLVGSGSSGFNDGKGTNAMFNVPTGVAIDASDNVYVADQNNNCIRIISQANMAASTKTLAGSVTPGFSDGVGTNAAFNFPTGVAVDVSGNVYVADNHNNCIRVVSPVGLVSTLAGNGSLSFGDGMGTNVAFNHPQGIAVDFFSGTVYVADTGNNRIRVISTCPPPPPTPASFPTSELVLCVIVGVAVGLGLLWRCCQREPSLVEAARAPLLAAVGHAPDQPPAGGRVSWISDPLLHPSAPPSAHIDGARSINSFEGTSYTGMYGRVLPVCVAAPIPDRCELWR